jgi:hypothetical protein
MQNRPVARTGPAETPELKYDVAGDRLTEYYAGTYHLPYNTLYGGVNPKISVT